MPLVIVALSGQGASVRQLQITLRPLQRLDRRFLIDAHDNRIVGRRHIEADHIGGLLANSGSLLSHQLLRPARSIFCLRSERQTYCTSTSPKAFAINGPFQRAKPLGGGRSRTARMRLSVGLAVDRRRTGPQQILQPIEAFAGKAPPPQADRRGVVSNSRAISRVAARRLPPTRSVSSATVVALWWPRGAEIPTPRALSASAEPRSHQVSSRS